MSPIVELDRSILSVHCIHTSKHNTKVRKKRRVGGFGAIAAASARNFFFSIFEN